MHSHEPSPIRVRLEHLHSRWTSRCAFRWSVVDTIRSALCHASYNLVLRWWTNPRSTSSGYMGHRYRALSLRYWRRGRCHRGSYLRFGDCTSRFKGNLRRAHAGHGVLWYIGYTGCRLLLKLWKYVEGRIWDSGYGRGTSGSGTISSSREPRMACSEWEDWVGAPGIAKD